MRMRACMLIGSAALLVTPSMALAADAEAGPMDFNPFQFLAAIIVFLVAFFVLSKTAWPKILNGLEEREEKIRKDIFAAEEANTKAQEAMAEYERSLASARAEANEMIEKTRAEQTRMAAQLKSEAEAELAGMRDDARRNIDAAKKAAISEIYHEAANIATAVAQKILEREVNVEDQRRLIDEAVGEFTQDFAKAEA